MALARYWRLTITSPAADKCGVGDLALMSAGDGAGTRLTTLGGAASCSTTLDSMSEGPQLAFDTGGTKAYSTYWTANATTGWLQWDFGAGNAQDVKSVVFTSGNKATSCLWTTGHMSYSDDGVNFTHFLYLTGLPTNVLSTAYIFTPPEIATIASTLPPLSLGATSGANVGWALPMLGATALPGTSTSLPLPAMDAYVVGHDAAGENDAAVGIPSLRAEAYGGANVTTRIPALSVGIGGVVEGVAQQDISLPALLASGGATVSGVGASHISLPPISAKAYSGAVCSVTIGGIGVLATGVVGAYAEAKITLPLFDAVAVATRQNFGGANISLPPLGVGSSTRVQAGLPSLQLVAIGHAVVTATYEAYALNLNHNDPTSNDEVTRYTNFPFTQIVRYQGSYFGVAADGLYLLEGTTDDGDAIPWEFMTTLSDFKSPFLKTVVSAYFGGRMGPAATVNLQAGEDAAKTYSYATTRSDHAQNYRQKFGRGLDSRYFAVGASGVGTLELDNIELNIQKSNRRI